MVRLFLIFFCGLSACGLGGVPFVNVTVTVPSGVVTPDPEILEFTVQTEDGGVQKQDIAQVNVDAISFPMVVNLTFENSARRQPVHIVVKGFVSNNPTELFFAEGDSEVGEGFLEVVAQYCGNGVVESARGETCDDGNVIDGDSCAANCSLAVCGNGILEPGEDCDDSNTTNGDGCSSLCAQEFCGDGVVNNNSPQAEECDDGNTTEGDGCDTNCTTSRCGNGIFAPQEVCLSAQTPLLVGDSPSDVQSADLNQDGRLDLVVANQFGAISVLSGDGAGQFSLATSIASVDGLVEALVIKDFNKDNLPDIAFLSTISLQLARQKVEIRPSSLL